MIIVDEPAFMGRKSGGNNPVMDGLVLWFDAQDEPVNDRTLLDRVSNTGINASGVAEYRYSLVRNGVYINVMPNQAYSPSSYYFQLPQQLVGHPTVEYCVSVPVTGFPREAWFGQTSIMTNQDGNLYYSHVLWGNIDITGVVNAGVPLHVVATFEDDKYALYINGERRQVGSVVSSYTMNYVFQLPVFNQSSRPNGVIDIGSIRVYNRPLTAEEVLKNYAYEQSLGRVQ